MGEFNHQRHKLPRTLEQPRALMVACPAMRSQVNLSRIVRAAGCCGVSRVIACGNARVDRKIARDGADVVELELRRSLAPRLKELKAEGFQLVGLEQTDASIQIDQFPFVRQTVLVVGHEREGIAPDVLKLLDAAVEIPVYGLPYSFNAATATAIALYEFCRQFPTG